MTTVHLLRVPARLNPGGLWVRQCSEYRLISEHPLGFDELTPEQSGDVDGLRAGELARDGLVAFTYIYDGDSGECLATLVTRP
jgi:hypothetical protein